VDILGTLNFILSVVIGLLILVILVAMHEFGHGVVARRNGVRVKEFGVGFPPRAKGWTVKNSILGKNVLYSLNWLPLGGFVNLQGENDSATKRGDFGAASFWAKTKILLAGVFVNWVTAAVLLSIVAAMGMPKLLDNQFMLPSDTTVLTAPVTVGSISSGLPADTVGIKVGDRLVSVAGVPMDDATKLTTLTKENQGKTIDITYERDGIHKTVPVTLRSDNSDKKGYLGLGGSQKTTYRSTWSAPVVGVVLTGQFTAYTFQGIGTTFVNFVTGLAQKLSFDGSTRQAGGEKLAEVNQNVGGPIAILGMLFPAALADGLGSLLLVTALIALTLAVMNVLPIPALDGGRWFVTFLYRKVLRKPLTREKEEQIHGTGFMVLMGLFVIIVIADIIKLGR
jgi:regulator of sigma E protease